MAGSGLKAVAGFVLPKEFAHDKRASRLRNFFKVFYNQLIEQGL